jgi:hypothetical protein
MMQAIGLCRFSYPALGGFQVEHETIEERIAFLYQYERLEERFRLFEAIALPCLRAQTDPDWGLVIIIGDQFPQDHLERLHDITADLPQITIQAHAPKPNRDMLKDVLNAARIDPDQPCLQFRYDDDDAVSVDFIEKFRKAAADAAPLTRQHRAVGFDWHNGYVAEFSADGIAATQMWRKQYVASLGVHIKGGAKVTIHNFAHEKIDRFMPLISFPDKAMWVRSHNGFNDSRQKKVKEVPVEPLTGAEEQIFKDRFAIDVDVIREKFAGFTAQGTPV